MAEYTLEEIAKTLRGVDKRPAYTTEDIAKILNCSTSTIYRYVKQGRLNVAFRVGQKLRFTQKEIDEFIQNQRPGQENPKNSREGGCS